MRAVNPYLNFAGNTEEAFDFYRSVFGGEFIGGIRRFEEFGDAMGELPEEDRTKVAHVALPLGEDNILMGTDALDSLGQSLMVGNNFSLTLETESEDETERLFNRLSAGGRVDMPLQKTQWAELYGICADRFGIQWMVNYGSGAS